jgi:hypothetical protein
MVENKIVYFRSKNTNSGRVLIIHSCNPSYSGGRNQEDHGSSQPGQTVQKHPSQKGAGGLAQGVGPEFKPQYCRKKGINSGRSTLIFFSHVRKSDPYFTKPVKSLELPAVWSLSRHGKKGVWT